MGRFGFNVGLALAGSAASAIKENIDEEQAINAKKDLIKFELNEKEKQHV